MQDVPAAVRRRGLSFACYDDPSRDAVIDADHAVSVNWETYLFADVAAAERFERDLVARCGLLTDPVSHRRFVPDATSPRLEYDGLPWYFESADTRDAFAREPQRFRLPHFTM